jgi:hypothetical protein
VKNASQRPESLFTNAQKTANLACFLCTNGGEKDPVPFAKVVEEYEIYNFPIIHLVHLCSKISSLDISNRAKSISTGQQRHAFAPTRDVVRIASPARVAGRPSTTAGAPL